MFLIHGVKSFQFNLVHSHNPKQMLVHFKFIFIYFLGEIEHKYKKRTIDRVCVL